MQKIHYLCISPFGKENYIQAWNIYRGHFSSPKESGISFHLANLIKNKNIQRLKKELYLENIRQKFFNQEVSRLNCVYLWDSKEDAKASCKRWPDFNNRKIVELGFRHEVPPTKVDTTWIDRYIFDSGSDNPDWAHEYWSKNATDEPLWEILCKGDGIYWDQEVQIESYNTIKFFDPDACSLLELSRLMVDAELRFDMNMQYINQGHIFPNLSFDPSNETLKIKYYSVYREDAEEEFISRFDEYRNKIPDHQINSDAFSYFHRVKGKSMRTPNLDFMNSEIPLSDLGLSDNELITLLSAL